MYEILSEFAKRPMPFSAYTTPAFWSDPHVGRSMLAFHLNENQDLASRRAETIDATVDRLDRVLTLKDKKVCDLGCGPGLYTARFHDRGAKTTGVDISPVTLHHARRYAEHTEREIHYIEADYTTLELTDQYNVITMIFCDFCVLSPEQRRVVLAKVKAALVPGGSFVFDVFSLAAFADFTEGALIEPNLMSGFWSPDDYVGFKKSFKYPDDHVSLDRYLIIERDRTWQVFNWLQYFSTDALSKELGDAGFQVDRIEGDLTGTALNEDSPTIAFFARVA